MGVGEVLAGVLCLAQFNQEQGLRRQLRMIEVRHLWEKSVMVLQEEAVLEDRQVVVVVAEEEEVV